MHATPAMSAYDIHVPSQNYFTIHTQALPFLFCFANAAQSYAHSLYLPILLRCLILVLPAEHPSYVRYGSSHIAVPFLWHVHL